MEEIVIKRAEGNDISEILRLLKEAALWLELKKINYWKDWINPPNKFTNWIKTGLENNEFFMVAQGTSIIGCFRLSWEDEIFWGKQKVSAGYIHSLTIDRKLKGKKMGYKVLRTIEKFCRESHKKYLRLDCSSEVPALKRYYENIGFRQIGETIVHGEKLTLYEKEIIEK
jgi:N-acetylglutamate synthase-like GNAT family acetyltransferase